MLSGCLGQVLLTFPFDIHSHMFLIQVTFSQAGLFHDSVLVIEVHLQPYVGKQASGKAASKTASAAKGLSAGKGALSVSGSTAATKPSSQAPSRQISRQQSQLKPPLSKAGKQTSRPALTRRDTNLVGAGEPRPSHGDASAGLYADERLVAWTLVKVFKGQSRSCAAQCCVLLNYVNCYF